MPNTPRVKLAFECNQAIEDMLLDEKGRHFCHQCQKSLHDFRRMPLQEIMAQTSLQEGCGVFTPEQVGRAPYALPGFTSIKKFLVATATFFVTETSFSQTSSDSSTYPQEQLDAHTLAEYASDYPPRDQNNKETRKIFRKKKKQGKTKSVSRDRVEYGIFFWKRFPFVSFKRRVYTNFTGFWIAPTNQ